MRDIDTTVFNQAIDDDNEFETRNEYSPLTDWLSRIDMIMVFL